MKTNHSKHRDLTFETASCASITHQQNLVISKHAEARLQQRGVKSAWIGLILEFGKEAYQKGKRSYSFSLDKAGIARLRRKYGNLAELTKLRNLYLIVSEDWVLVTCAYR